jgi:DNA-binding transcriptional LysR family regulator
MNDWDLGFDLDKLQAFYAVVRLGGVGAAARALGRSQPAVSHRLRALADGLGVELFEKVGRRLQTTAAGDALAERCAELFALARDLENALASQHDGDVRGVVRIGTYATVASHLLAPGLAALLEAHPELTVRFSFELAGPLIRRLEAGELDVVLVAGHRLGEVAGLAVERIGSDPMLAVAAPDLVPPRVPRLRALRALRQLAWEGDDETFAQVRAYVEAERLSSARTAVIPHLETLRRLALRGVGWTIVPRYVVAGELASGALVDLKLRGLAVSLDFHRLVRARAVTTPASRAVMSLLEELPLKGLTSRRANRP